MEAFHLDRGFIVQSLVIGGIVTIVSLLLAGLLGWHDVAIEGGPLERGQELALLLAFVVFAGSASIQRGSGRMASVGASVLAMVFFLRELELTGHGPVATIFNGPHFRLYEGIVIAAIAVPYLALRWRLIPEHLAYLRQLRGWPFVCVAVLLFIGEAFDGHPSLAGIDYLPMFIEETVELVAYILYATIGLHVLANARAVRRLEAEGRDFSSERPHKAL